MIRNGSLLRIRKKNETDWKVWDDSERKFHTKFMLSLEVSSGHTPAWPLSLSPSTNHVQPEVKEGRVFVVIYPIMYWREEEGRSCVARLSWTEDRAMIKRFSSQCINTGTTGLHFKARIRCSLAISHMTGKLSRRVMYSCGVRKHANTQLWIFCITCLFGV